jgi:hypothetical protein
MKESYVEGLASYGGPESCVHARKGVGEALTGVRAGRVSSREIHAPRRELRVVRGAEVLETDRRPHRCSRGSNPDGEAASDPARSKTPRTRGNISHGNREIPRPAAARRETLAAARIEKPMGVQR